jgi:uncharacterized protein (DUF362 family)
MARHMEIGIAISSTDSLAADRIACEVMGVNFQKVGYLHFCKKNALGVADMQKIDIISHKQLC